VSAYRILKPGYNCWRVAHARRAAFLVDAADYFRAFRAAAARTRHALHIVGWDINSRVRLLRGGADDGWPLKLGPFLNAVVAQPHAPHAYVLAWDFAMLYALDREWLPAYKLEWRAHRRLHFRMDGEHPPGGSHHQKMVVVDDALAFVGGLDLTRARWDTPAHSPGDPRRVETAPEPYRPFHDIELLVQGDVSAALGELVRDRWERATGERLAPPPGGAPDAWPAHVTPDVEDLEIAVARTDPTFDGRAEVREVERLYLDAIRAARHSIYIENQFFTARAIADALAERLREPHGPEVVMVLSRRADGWLSRQTMDVIRGHMLERLRAADRHGRLRVYYPDVPGLAPQTINVHSKLMIVDEDFVRVGSANLNNRSMGIDTECDLAFESRGEARVRRAIAGLRHRLLAEHLGTTPAAVAAAIQGRSLVRGVEALRTGGRTLKDMPTTPVDEAWLPSPELLDPERPIHPSELTQQFVPPDVRIPAGRRLVAAAGLLLLLLGLAAAWRWTPLGELLDVAWLSDQLASFGRRPLAPALTVSAFVLGGLLVLPVTLLVIVTALAFGPVAGFAYSLAGALTSAAVLYGLGRWLGRDVVRRFAGPRVNRLSRRLASRGLLTVVFVRVVPVAPFSVVNLVAGASAIGLRDYLVGTLLGMAPGIALIALFVDRVNATLREPALEALWTLGAIAALFLLVIWVLRRFIALRQKPRPAGES
jgi:phosphatidylserine/phosphatidylglycerophosphate/cardiolipin synthase-like enzyme/membrane protein DedA with SNARE-associated domain